MDITISPKQLDLMKHTIGLTEQTRFERPARAKIYKAYRNHFSAGAATDDELEKLCYLKLCKRHEGKPHKDAKLYYTYVVTQEGADVIKAYTGVTVILD